MENVKKLEFVSLKQLLLSNKKLLVMFVLSFLGISIIGTLLHFTYGFLNGNIIVGAFSAVNESVFEHLKIAVLPIIIMAIIERKVFRKISNNKYILGNFCIAKLTQVIVTVATIVGVFYGYKAILKTGVLWIDIILFYIAIFLGLLCQYIIIGNSLNIEIISLKKRIDIKRLNLVACYLVVFVFMYFIYATYIPPKIELFRDSVTDTYGIFKERE